MLQVFKGKGEKKNTITFAKVKPRKTNKLRTIKELRSPCFGDQYLGTCTDTLSSARTIILILEISEFSETIFQKTKCITVRLLNLCLRG